MEGKSGSRLAGKAGRRTWKLEQERRTARAPGATPGYARRSSEPDVVDKQPHPLPLPKPKSAETPRLPCLLAVSSCRTWGYAKSPQRGPVGVHGVCPGCIRCVPGVCPVCAPCGCRNAQCLRPFLSVWDPLSSVSCPPASWGRPFNLLPTRTQTSRTFSGIDPLRRVTYLV